VIAELLWTAGFDRELQEIFDFLEDRLPGSGERFVLNLDRSLGLLRQYPESAPRFRTLCRRLVLASGYGVFYQINGSRIVLVALLHLSLPIEAILRRLGEVPDPSL
jgi:plasmid stabilization system protein ParE